MIGKQSSPKYRPGEDIDAHGGQIADGLGRLLREIHDAILIVAFHNAEAAGFLPGDGHNGNRQVGLMCLVFPQHFVIIHGVKMVAGQDQYIFGIIGIYKVDVVIDGIGSAQIPGAAGFRFIRRQNVDTAVAGVHVPCLAVAQIGVEDGGLVLGQNTHSVDAGIDAVGKAEVDDAVLAAEGNGGFGIFFGQGQQTAALSASQKHGNTFFFSHGDPPF